MLLFILKKDDEFFAAETIEIMSETDILDKNHPFLTIPLE